MPYLVDGNNVMAQTVGWHSDKAAARRRLIQNLARFLAARRVKVKVVFDGAPDDEFPEGVKFKSVHVLYARPGSDADTRIQELIRKSSSKRDLIVVTSDRSLAAFARRQGTRVVPAGQFRKMLQEVLGADSKESAPDRPINVEDWMNYFNGSDH